VRVGLLGGTFNPPHLGHLVCAQEALSGLGLDRVLLVPVREPPHKAVEVEPGLEHRVAMCAAAVAGAPRFGVSRVDADRPGPSYTADTLRALGGDDDLWFIVGGDMALSLPAWAEPSVVLSLARLGVAEREGVRREDVRERLAAALPDAGERVDFFEMPRMDISSSLIRRRVRAGLPIRYLVPDAVAAYIEREGLYRDGEGLRPGS
jgi:nicotinate-nucleotide adenylyltransferase